MDRTRAREKGRGVWCVDGGAKRFREHQELTGFGRIVQTLRRTGRDYARKHQ
jgi:hypothetical protein